MTSAVSSLFINFSGMRPKFEARGVSRVMQNRANNVFRVRLGKVLKNIN
jgi:hypothetical protein